MSNTTMTDDERSELRALLYSEDNAPKKKDIHIDPSGFNRSRNIHVEAIKYEVPTVEYVSRLEQMVTNQARLINQLQQAVNKLQRFMGGTRKFIKNQSRHITDMQHDIDQKIDSRE